jgi:hypothetical protein
MQPHSRHPTPNHLDTQAGEWITEATLPTIPNTVSRGRASGEWLEARHFLIWRSSNEHLLIPDVIATHGYAAANGDGPSSDASGGGATAALAVTDPASLSPTKLEDLLDTEDPRV